MKIEETARRFPPDGYDIVSTPQGTPEVVLSKRSGTLFLAREGWIDKNQLLFVNRRIYVIVKLFNNFSLIEKYE